MNGFIKLYRQLELWEWYLNPNTLRLFIHCLIKANYEDKEWQGIIIEKGSFISSIGKLAEELNLSVKQVRVALNHLKATNEVTSKGTNKYTVFYISNWAKYQSDEFENGNVLGKEKDKQRANKGQTKGNNKELKEIKEVKEFIKPLSFDKVKIDIFGDFANGDEELLKTLKEFNEMRIRIRKPMTDKAKEMLVNKLQEFKDKGHNIIEILEQSVFNSWQGVFEVKEEFRKIKQKEKPVEEQRTGTYF